MQVNLRVIDCNENILNDVNQFLRNYKGIPNSFQPSTHFQILF